MTIARMLKITAATAALAAAPAAAFADSHTGGDMSDSGSMNSGRVSSANIENLIRTSNIIGGNVYTVEADYDMGVWEETDVYDTVDAEWERIGNIDDIAISPDGQLVGFVVESGGFLGIGDDSVLLELQNLRMIDDGSGDYNWVTDITEDQFEAMPEVEENWF